LFFFVFVSQKEGQGFFVSRQNQVWEIVIFYINRFSIGILI